MKALIAGHKSNTISENYASNFASNNLKIQYKILAMVVRKKLALTISSNTSSL